jgi:hypothetical protein
MRFYLDTNVFQYLKLSENSTLYSLFIDDTKENIYCFSEAHIYDLVRDQTDEKLKDMSFMETIVSDNCWSYNKQIIFKYQTPFEYYDSFDWTPIEGILNGEDTLSTFMRMMLSAIPLNLAELIKESDLPPNFPENFKTLFSRSTNMYEFMQAFFDMTTELTVEQKEFKKMIRYLHDNSLTGDIYRALKLEGFDGKKLTDKQKFRDSYIAHFMQNKKEVYRYDLFLQLHSGLEILGIVKGKPKKQKMMNMVNDGRHAFFGSFCDILVSEDADMINKTKFLYDLLDIGTKVMTINEFVAFQANRKPQSGEIKAMLKELEHFDELDTIWEEKDAEKIWIAKKMKHTYLGLFDCVNHVITSTYSYSYFNKHSNNLSTGTLIKEIEYVTNHAISFLGPDIDGKQHFSPHEMEEEKWGGRNWLIEETGIQLFLDKKLCFAFFRGKSPKPAE